MQQVHEQKFQVRDYECDQQGVVNNAVYMNYLEHARHEFLKRRGIDFAEVTRQGIHLVLVKAEMSFKSSLKSGDQFIVRTRFERESRLKMSFYQDLVRRPDEHLMLTAKMTATALNNRGRPFVPEAMLQQMG